MIDGLGGAEIKPTPYTFNQGNDNTWWAVWSGYSLGPYPTKDRAEEEWYKAYNAYGKGE